MKTLIIDCDAVCWSIFTAIRNPTPKKIDNLIVYGFLNHLIFTQTRERADNIVFAWDSVVNNRKKVFPEYKQKRSAKKKEYTEEEKEIHRVRVRQFIKLRTEVLPALGFNNVFHADGFEGDDIIASVVQDNPSHDIVMIARDNDIFQLITDRVVAFDWVKRKWFNRKSFEEQYGINPERWGKVKSIAGCPGDEVPGIAGIGYARAVSYLKGTMNPNSKYYKNIEANKETIDFTSKLVVLPFEGTPSFEISSDECTMEKLAETVECHGLTSFNNPGRRKDWKELFVHGGEKTFAEFIKGRKKEKAKEKAKEKKKRKKKKVKSGGKSTGKKGGNKKKRSEGISDKEKSQF